MTESSYTSVHLSSPTQESLPPYSPIWKHHVDEKHSDKRWNWKWGSRSEWAAAYENAPHVFNAALKSVRWPGGPMKKKKAILLEQLYAFLLVIVFAMIPMTILFVSTSVYGVFQDKVISCGNSFGTPENATVSGIEKLFVLDSTFGKFTFSQVKVLDVAWDVFIGRGVQLLAWWIAYIVFNDALLRAIERHPASFQIFQRIALEGPSLLSLYTLVRELWCARSHRTKALFFYIWISTLYIISIPMLLGAMTGYDSTSIAWVSLDDSNNIIPAAALKSAYLVHGTWNDTWENDVCFGQDMYSAVQPAQSERRDNCNCQLPNGTITSAERYVQYYYSSRYNELLAQCRFDYPGNNQTFRLSYGTEGERGDIKSCAHSFNVTINGKDYDALKINGSSGYCYNSKPYTYSFLQDKSRCLPDTANPSYEWGFSTALTGLFVIFNFVWALTMYALWQDAHWNSTLVKSGYQMTALRAAFAMAKAARRKTGMGEKQLVRANTKELNQELYGSRKIQGTSVEYGIFEEGDEEHGEVRRRIVRPKDEDEGQEMATIVESSVLRPAP